MASLGGRVGHAVDKASDWGVRVVPWACVAVACCRSGFVSEMEATASMVTQKEVLRGAERSGNESAREEPSLNRCRTRAMGARAG